MPIYEGRIPKTLRAWCEKHPHLVEEVSYGGGYATDSGMSYDVLLASGWSLDCCHTVYGTSVSEVIANIQRAERCDCNECWERIAKDITED